MDKSPYIINIMVGRWPIFGILLKLSGKYLNLCELSLLFSKWYDNTFF